MIENGFESLKKACMDSRASDFQVSECKRFFFAGAAHVFSEIVKMTNNNAMTNEEMSKNFDNINSELRNYFNTFCLENTPINGRIN